MLLFFSFFFIDYIQFYYQSFWHYPFCFIRPFFSPYLLIDLFATSLFDILKSSSLKSFFRYNVAKKKKDNVEKGKLKKNKKVESDKKSDGKNNGKNKNKNKKKNVGIDDEDDDDVMNITLDGHGDDDENDDNNDDKENTNLASQRTKDDEKTKNGWEIVFNLKN